MGKRELVALAAEPVMASRFRTRKLLEPDSDVDCKCDDSLPSYPSACPMNVQLTCCCCVLQLWSRREPPEQPGRTDVQGPQEEYAGVQSREAPGFSDY